jgi:hypothetical protein
MWLRSGKALAHVVDIGHDEDKKDREFGQDETEHPYDSTRW